MQLYTPGYSSVIFQLLIDVCTDRWKYNEISIYCITLVIPLWKENMPHDHILRPTLHDNVPLPTNRC